MARALVMRKEPYATCSSLNLTVPQSTSVCSLLHLTVPHLQLRVLDSTIKYLIYNYTVCTHVVLARVHPKDQAIPGQTYLMCHSMKPSGSPFLSACASQASPARGRPTHTYADPLLLSLPWLVTVFGRGGRIQVPRIESLRYRDPFP